MGLKISEWIALFCFCVCGIQNSYQMVAEMREIRMNCIRDGGFCINIIPPAPPRRRQNRQNRRRMRTSTRRGQRARRPSPQSVGQSHTRLPASARAATPNFGGYPPQPAAVQPYDQFTPVGQVGGAAAGRGTMGGAGAMGGAAGQGGWDMFGNMGMMSMMFTRKKRQAAAVEPGEAAERPRIRRGENTMQFLNTHCRKTDFDIGCQQTGGICCLPPL